MSKANPKKAMAALLPLAIDCGGGVLVAPMTLGMYAALERIGSPLITGEEPKDTLELIPSLYLLTHDPREVFLGNVVDLAMQWAAGQPVTAIGRIREAAERQIGAMLDVLPEAEKKRPAGRRRVDRGLVRALRRAVRVELARGHVGNASIRHRHRAPARTQRTDVPAERDRKNGRRVKRIFRLFD